MIASLSTSAGRRIARHDDHARLLDALRDLQLDQQLLIELHYWEGLNGGELGAIFDVEPATIGSRFFRAREALRLDLRRTDGRSQTSIVNAHGDPDFADWARTPRPDRDDGERDH